jgi:hypothetical protein
MRLSCVLFLLAITGVSLGQQPNTADGDIRLSKDHPAVYLTFERRGKGIDPLQSRLGETGDTNNPKQKGVDIWLRFHNNLRWAILFPTGRLYLGRRVSLYPLSDGTKVYVLDDGMEVNAKYIVEESDGRIVRYGSDVSSSSWLAPGRSVIFSVDRSHLSKGRSIYIYFNYQWERGQSYSNNLAPEHRCMYWGYRLTDAEAK